MLGPNPKEKYPMSGNPNIQFAKNMVEQRNVEIGEYTYYSAEAGESFATCIQHHYEFLGDKLIIGKFNSLAAGLKIIMNGANHRMDGSTFPFNIFGHGWESATPDLAQLPYKGDTVIGNDVWIGQHVTLMPGVKIGNGAIIAANSTVVKEVPAYTIVGGNPATIIKQRFSNELIERLEQVAWWELPIDVISANLQAITAYDIDALESLVEQSKS